MKRGAFDKTAALAKILLSPVRVGQTWQHTKTGGCYVIVALAIEEATLTPVVVYKGSNEIVWTRPLDEFIGRKGAERRFVNDDSSIMEQVFAYGLKFGC